jgi:hypothetical protein
MKDISKMYDVSLFVFRQLLYPGGWQHQLTAAPHQADNSYLKIHQASTSTSKQACAFVGVWVG